MIWAKEPPTPELVAEALVLLDQLVIDGIAGSVRDVWTERRTMHLSGTAYHPIVGIYDRVMAESVPQYLRIHPVSRYSRHSRYLSLEDEAASERHYLCLFCRENLGTIGAAKYIRQRDRATATTLLRAAVHADLCAARFLAGQIRGGAPRLEERMPSVTKLIGKRLISDAKLAAAYLGLEEPRAKFSRAEPPFFVTRGRASPLRRIITDARKAAAEVAQKAATEPAWRAA